MEHPSARPIRPRRPGVWAAFNKPARSPVLLHHREDGHAVEPLHQVLRADRRGHLRGLRCRRHAASRRRTVSNALVERRVRVARGSGRRALGVALWGRAGFALGSRRGFLGLALAGRLGLALGSGLLFGSRCCSRRCSCGWRAPGAPTEYFAQDQRGEQNDDRVAPGGVSLSLDCCGDVHSLRRGLGSLCGHLGRCSCVGRLHEEDFGGCYAADASQKLANSSILIIAILFCPKRKSRLSQRRSVVPTRRSRLAL